MRAQADNSIKTTPMLVVGDSPTLPTGLGRIARDITSRIVDNIPELRVAQLGLRYQGEALPWHVYPAKDEASWGSGDIAAAWMDWSRGRRGVIFTIWDPGRCPGLIWAIDQLWAEQGLDPKTRPEFWGYFAVDGADYRGELGGPVPDMLMHYARVLAYTQYGEGVLRKTIGAPGTDAERKLAWLPHGVDLQVFKPAGKLPEDVQVGWVNSDWPVIGVVATNTPRKDWGAVFAALAGVQCHLWVHTDLQSTMAWSLPELARQYGRDNRDMLHLTISGALDDEQLAAWYEFCDITVAPGAEGFGYPIVESLACGTPVVGVGVAGGAEIIPKVEWRVYPRMDRLEGAYALVRPVIDPGDLRDRIFGAVQWARLHGEVGKAYCRAAVGHLGWEENLWSWWEKWVREGLH